MSTASTERPLALVVDDEPSMRDIVTFALETQDFETCTAGSAEAAWALLQRRSVDLVVLDVMLPGLSGVELCRRIAQTTGIPVILLTALGETSRRIAGLEAGAADYVAKPFHPRELALRAAGLVRRSPLGDGQLTHGPLTVNLRSATAWVAGRRVDLTNHEFRLVAAFAGSPGETLPFRRLLLTGWGDPDLPGGRELLKTAVYRLRMKLGTASRGADAMIRSVRGVGYAFDPDAAEGEEATVTEP
ncbi:response regulator transcription factor [Phycicoccus sp. DTK01]|uniref:response regulator transcription factor n=1 Tax=Phycicoccus sp. DTK01 TaxID=2785745 RepID=UPI001A8D0E7F|nr:response regulator transcription factor [Phycicoccus sp. DTK01]GIL35050.1 DNA-binding response regulator [Phycicoccus sp. DTK01]